ncbi:peptidase M61 [Pedobacter sp. FW305-3-2-15-E-R2A2]|uniref:M61 family metallopeptidase n=1 Tax=Pedobacter sp. FW305-3-2-15-E-R2A2 TaxID=3140251 RepID=UPI00313FFA18
MTKIKIWFAMAVMMAWSFTVFAKNKGIQFTVAIENPQSHYYQVEMRCVGFQKDKLNFKLPAWTPGYYWMMNFAKNVVKFRVRTAGGKELNWKKVDKNNWEVKTGRAEELIVSYDVFANTASVADPFLDESHAYISPAGVFMHIDGELDEPAEIALKFDNKWTKVSTGLDELTGKLNTYRAEDFDTLYDSPIYIGNQETMTFNVKGIRHTLAIANTKAFDTARLVADLKKIVTAATDIMVEIPYQHYTFIIMGPGQGGLEHRNSTAVFSSPGYMMETKAAYNGWLSFLAHEYFHLYNIKAIRPLALGPFNYDKENLTRMLWVSEGFTVYYEYIVLYRAGLLSKEEFLDAISAVIRNYENVPGSLVQSATESSFDTWIQFFNRNENASKTTISYYDKGCALAFLLDLKIRQASNSSKSLDDVMRRLYKDFYLDKKRGFTDDEFKHICEEIAGTSLSELFNYASSVDRIDYQKYLDTGGFTIDLSPLPDQGLGTDGFLKRNYQIHLNKGADFFRL